MEENRAHSHISLRAILSERANYIVSKMAHGCDYSAALLDAQQNWNGDTTKDYEGRDAVGRLALLVEHCFGTKISSQDIFCRGIAFLSPIDFEMAAFLGYAIKYLGIVKCINEASFVTPGNCQLDVRMHATMIGKQDPLALVDGEQVAAAWSSGNEWQVTDKQSSFLEDLPQFPKKGALQVRNILDLKARYYIRFSLQDSAAAVAEITNTLREKNLGIQQVHKKIRQPGAIGPLIVVTHEANEKDVREALKIIDGLDFITQMTKMIRIEK